MHVTDRNVFRAFDTGVEILRHIRERYPNYFEWKPPPYEYEYHKLPIEVLLGRPLRDFFPD